jgi:hypothetical protein
MKLNKYHIGAAGIAVVIIVVIVFRQRSDWNRNRFILSADSEGNLNPVSESYFENKENEAIKKLGKTWNGWQDAVKIDNIANRWGYFRLHCKPTAQSIANRTCVPYHHGDNGSISLSTHIDSHRPNWIPNRNSLEHANWCFKVALNGYPGDFHTTHGRCVRRKYPTPHMFVKRL